MVDIEKCSMEELEELGELVADKNLQEEVKRELVKRKSKSACIVQYKYQSEQIPNFKKENSELCEEILSQIGIEELSFVTVSFLDRKNNIGGYFFPESHNIRKHLFHDEKGNFNDLVELFSDEDLQRKFEGTYNMINYVVNSVYRNIDTYDGVLTKEILFEELPIRRLIVKDKFTEIMESLWQTREEIPGARICIGNSGLTRNKNKSTSTKYVTLTQNALINSVAFGCSYDELSNGNYEGAKKLVYVPRENLKKI